MLESVHVPVITADSALNVEDSGFQAVQEFSDILQAVTAVRPCRGLVKFFNNCARMLHIVKGRKQFKVSAADHIAVHFIIQRFFEIKAEFAGNRYIPYNPVVLAVIPDQRNQKQTDQKRKRDQNSRKQQLQLDFQRHMLEVPKKGAFHTHFCLPVRNSLGVRPCIFLNR